VNAIMAPPASTADRVIETLATYLNEHSADAGGGHQRTMLIAALISRLFDITPTQAVELARGDAFDDRVKVAERALTEILSRVQTTGHRTPAPGEVVVRDSYDGVWIVRGYEDDDTVWIHRPDVPMTPTVGPADSGMAEVGGWLDEPSVCDLAPVAELRPVETAAEVTL
jgi:hypothetical protein